MGEKRLRPVDLAREHGLSAQAVRNYEEEGILPVAGRTRHGYRIYTPLHARALRAFVALVPAHGHGIASDVMRAVNAGDIYTALTLLDESHAQLLQDRKTLAAVDTALRDLASSAAPAPPHRELSSSEDSRGNWGSYRRLCASGRRPRCSAPSETRTPAIVSTLRQTFGTRTWRTNLGVGATCCARSRL